MGCSITCPTIIKCCSPVRTKTELYPIRQTPPPFTSFPFIDSSPPLPCHLPLKLFSSHSHSHLPSYESSASPTPPSPSQPSSQHAQPIPPVVSSPHSPTQDPIPSSPAPRRSRPRSNPNPEMPKLLRELSRLSTQFFEWRQVLSRPVGRKLGKGDWCRGQR